MSFLEQVFAQMGADKPRAPRDHISQMNPPISMVHSVQNFMLDPTRAEVAILLTLTAISAFFFLRRFAPVVAIIRASKPDPGILPDAHGKRFLRFVWEVLLQAKVIKERPLPGIAHAFVFWGFLAFALITINHFAAGLGLQVIARNSFF